MTEPTHLLLVSGSTRSRSTNSAALRAAHASALDGVQTALYDGLAELPAFNPDEEMTALPPVVADLRSRIAWADGVLFCTPEYAGSLPGSFKNLLDWTVGGAELYGKPVAWINVAGAGRGANAEATLRTVLGYVGAVIVEDACRRIVVERDTVDADGLITDDRVRSEIQDLAATFAAAARDLRA